MHCRLIPSVPVQAGVNIILYPKFVCTHWDLNLFLKTVAFDIDAFFFCFIYKEGDWLPCAHMTHTVFKAHSRPLTHAINCLRAFLTPAQGKHCRKSLCAFGWCILLP